MVSRSREYRMEHELGDELDVMLGKKIDQRLLGTAVNLADDAWDLGKRCVPEDTPFASLAVDFHEIDLPEAVSLDQVGHRHPLDAYLFRPTTVKVADVLVSALVAVVDIDPVRGARGSTFYSHSSLNIIQMKISGDHFLG